MKKFVIVLALLVGGMFVPANVRAQQPTYCYFDHYYSTFKSGAQFCIEDDYDFYCYMGAEPTWLYNGYTVSCYDAY